MSHLSTFHAVRFRGISGLRLDSLAPVNLITGSNGVGKSSVAEAIWLFSGRFVPILPWSSHVQRSAHAVIDPLERLSDTGVVKLAGTERDASSSWKAAFESTPTAGDTGAGSLSGNGPPPAERQVAEPQRLPVPIRGRLRIWLDEVEVDGRNGAVAQVHGEGGVIIPAVNPPAGCAIAILHSPLSSMDVDTETINRFSELVAEGRKDDVKQALRVILPLLVDVDVITDSSGQPYVLATTTSRERLPLQALGGGMTRLFRLFVSFHQARGGLIIVDEIENGLHHLAMPEFWRRIRVMIDEFDVQLFATTHSAECLHAVMEAFSDRPNGIAVHTLHRKADRVQASTYTGETLHGARDLDLEIR